MGTWHILTSEYPPRLGGVSGYCQQVAAGLAGEGSDVHVWCPAGDSSTGDSQGVTIHRIPGNFGIASLRRLGQELNAFPKPQRLLVQWVPHGYGWRSMNLPLCVWLWNRSARHGDEVQIMVHEPFLSFGEGSWRQDMAAVVHRLMVMILLRAAHKVWVSIPEWERRWHPYALGRRVPFQWLPIPSNIPVVDDNARIHTTRRQYAAGGEQLIGHFGTYGAAVTELLEPVITAANGPGRVFLLMGMGSQEFRDRLTGQRPELAGTVVATGALPAEDLSPHVAACDLLIQPFLDGVSSRRTSIMVGLCHGKAIVTTVGPSSEAVWTSSGAVATAAVGDTPGFVNLVEKLACDAGERARLGQAARELYQARFDIAKTIAELDETVAREPACAF